MNNKLFRSKLLSNEIVSLIITSQKINIISGDKSLFADTPKDAFSGGIIVKAEEVARVVKNLFKQNRIKNKKVIVSLGSEGVLLRLLNVPFLQPEAIKDIVCKEVSKYIFFDRINSSASDEFAKFKTMFFENKFLYSDDLSFSVRNYTETTPDSLYSFGAEHIFFSSNNATLIVDSGFLSPNYNDSVFFARVGVQTDKFDFAFDRLNMRNLRLVDLITDNTFWMDKLELDGLHGSDFRNKIYPKPKNHHPKMPATALRSLNFDLLIDSLVVQNSQFTYREYLPPALKPGEIWFTDINISGKNITNNSEKIEMDSLMSFDVNAKIMGEGDLSLTFNFDIENNNNNWEAVGKLKYFDLTHLNPMLENAAFVKVTKGYNDFLKFKISANRQLATGNMTFGYEKLHIRLIDKKTLLTSGIDESIASFIANTFVVRRNNPRFPFRTRQGEIFFRRDSTKSYFNYFTV